MADLKFTLLIALVLVIGGCANQPSLSAGSLLDTTIGAQAELEFPAAQLLSIAPNAAPFLASESLVISTNADGTIDLRNNTAAVRHASSDHSLGQPLLFAASELPPTFTQCPLMEPLSTQLSRLTRTTRFLQPY